MFYLTIVFFYEYARGRYALNGRVTLSRLACLVFPFPVAHATGSHTCTFPSPFHVFSFTCTNMDCQLVSLHFTITNVSFRLVDLSAYVSRLCLSSFVSLTHLPTRYFWNLDSLAYLRLICLPSDVCTCIVVCCSLTIYTGWRWGSVPHLQSTLQPP